MCDGSIDNAVEQQVSACIRSCPTADFSMHEVFITGTASELKISGLSGFNLNHLFAAAAVCRPVAIPESQLKI